MKFYRKIIKIISGFTYKQDVDYKEETDRRICLMNILLKVIFLLSLSSLIKWIISYFNTGRSLENATPLFILVFFVLLSLVLIKISSKGYPRTVASVLVILLLLATFKTSYTWGVILPMSVATYALLIFISGILIGPKQAILLTVIIAMFLLTIFHLQNNGLIKVNTHWKQIPSTYSDVIILDIIYFVIATVSWLSGREINKSLKRARKSENEALKLADKLKKQNENLETIVEQRTKELREHQLEQLTSLNNYAVYGKISAGLLHDIKNPLTVISLNLDSLKNASKEPFENKRKFFSGLINKSLLASKTVESIIKSSQNQFLNENTEEPFDLIKEIHKTLLLIEHKAAIERIKLTFKHDKKIILKGYPTKLSRVIANLVINSIDSFKDKKDQKKLVEISTKSDKNDILITIKDNGCGIKEEVVPEIFKPLFSTKNNSEHAGLGLYCSRKIIEDYFRGEITFTSEYGDGSEFVIKIPNKKNENSKK